ncbi:STAS domain-containing protein [candidate division KSB1 bacterium]|nr:STAS domain-containing protein [candidate division KSB1 bacterium]
MQYKIIQLENATIIVPKGEIDAYLVPEFKQVIEEQTERGNNTIIIDLKHVSYLDSSALGLLVS